MATKQNKTKQNKTKQNKTKQKAYVSISKGLHRTSNRIEQWWGHAERVE